MEDFFTVGEFMDKFGHDSVNVNGAKPRVVSREMIRFRLQLLFEELTEIAKALGYEISLGTHPTPDRTEILDIVEIADGLVDMSYVTLGMAHVLGLPWPALFAEVHRANMTKTRALIAEDSKRGSTFDVVKPAGWTPPNIAGVLRQFGWKIEEKESV